MVHVTWLWTGYVEVEEVQRTKYFGAAMFNEEASCDNEIENRIETATKWWGH